MNEIFIGKTLWYFFLIVLLRMKLQVSYMNLTKAFVEDTMLGEKLHKKN
jgi:hypothetical protein